VEKKKEDKKKLSKLKQEGSAVDKVSAAPRMHT
jgi:hypothetical protein